MSQPPAYSDDQTKQVPPPDSGYYPKQSNQPSPQQQYPQQGTVYYAPGQPPAFGPQQYTPGQPQQPTVVMVSRPPTQSYTGHIAFACCSFCCCGPFGLISLILAIMANSQSSSQPESARTMGKWSIGISAVNIVIGIIAWILVILYFVFVFSVAVAQIAAISAERNSTLSDFCHYLVEGTCYTSRENSLGYMSCRGNGFYHNRFCYYN